jgi:hypothetical protein
VQLANYAAAARSYRRPLIWFTAIPVAIWIVTAGIGIGIALRMPDFPKNVPGNVREEVFLQTQEVERRFVRNMLAIPAVMFLIGAGASLSVHLKEMLGNPNSRLTPDLQRTHLVLASLLIAIFTVAAPLAAASQVDIGMSAATVVAWSLTLFAASALIVHWFPYALPPAVAIACLFIGLASRGRGSSWSLNPTTTWALIIVSLGGLTSIGWRLAHLHEGMFEYHRRWKAEPRDSRGFPWFFPQGDMRVGRRAVAPVAETLLGRALRWHAAWKTMWVALGLGLFVGGILGAMAALKGFAIPEYVGSPNVAYLAIFPVVMLMGPSRRYLIEELVRPPSRREQVRAVGLAMAAVVVVGWLLIQTVGVLAIVIWGRSGTSVAGIWESVAFSLCCLPVLFGAAVWPYRTSILFMTYSALFGVMASFLLTPLRLSGSVLVGTAPAILIVGLWLTRASYLRWVNHDAVPGPALFGSGAVDGGGNRPLMPRKLQSHR